MLHSYLAYRPVQPCSGPDVHADRVRALVVPVWGLGQLRAWVHEQGPARFRGHGDRTIPRSRQQHFRERVPAFRLPGHRVSGKGDPVLFLSNPKGVDSAARKRVVDAINDLNREQLHGVGDPEIATRISQYEMAYRMQSSVPELKDLSTETSATLDAYGAKVGGSGFSNNCLLARRMVERGVRFVQLFDQGWDHHSGLQRVCLTNASRLINR